MLVELGAGGVEGFLLGFGDSARSADPFLLDQFGDDFADRHLLDLGVVVAAADELAAEHPAMVAVSVQGLSGKTLVEQVEQESGEEFVDVLAWSISCWSTCQRSGPCFRSGQYAAKAALSASRILVSRPTSWLLPTLLLTRLLNACHHFPGFVYAGAKLRAAVHTIEVEVRPRQGSKARCSGCHQAASGYDQMPQRGFEFIPIWGFAVVLLYCMRRVDCRRCGGKVEEVPWGTGKHQLTTAYMLYLAHWARKRSWKQTTQSFHASWGKVHQAVAYVVESGLQPRHLGAGFAAPRPGSSNNRFRSWLRTI